MVKSFVVKTVTIIFCAITCVLAGCIDCKYTFKTTPSIMYDVEKVNVSTININVLEANSFRDDFTAWFLGNILCYANLRHDSVDSEIFAELNSRLETTLFDVACLIEKQKNGENGALLKNGRTNIFYIRDNADVLRTVSVCWLNDGWNVGSYPIGDECTWCAGDRVFFRDSQHSKHK